MGKENKSQEQTLTDSGDFWPDQGFHDTLGEIRPYQSNENDGRVYYPWALWRP